MRAITVQQPWAWLIIHGGKDIENRGRFLTWRPAVGERVAIHAGKAWSRPATEHPAYQDATRSVTGPARAALDIRGAIIGTVRVADLHVGDDCCPPWGDADDNHLVLTDPRPCPPIPCRGQLGLWYLPPAIVAALEPQWWFAVWICECTLLTEHRDEIPLRCPNHPHAHRLAEPELTRCTVDSDLGLRSTS